MHGSSAGVKTQDKAGLRRKEHFLSGVCQNNPDILSGRTFQMVKTSQPLSVRQNYISAEHVPHIEFVLNQSGEAIAVNKEFPPAQNLDGRTVCYAFKVHQHTSLVVTTGEGFDGYGRGLAVGKP
jgi:hypothetical protein